MADSEFSVEASDSRTRDLELCNRMIGMLDGLSLEKALAVLFGCITKVALDAGFSNKEFEALVCAQKMAFEACNSTGKLN